MYRRPLVIALAFAMATLLLPTRSQPVLAQGCGNAPAKLGSRQPDDRERWRVDVPEAGSLIPVLVTDDVVVAAETPPGCVLAIASIRGIDVATGEELWIGPTDLPGRLDNMPVGIGDTVYVNGSFTAADGETRTNWLAALDPETGEPRWQVEFEPGADPASEHYSIAGGDDDLLLLTQGSSDGGQIIGVDPASGDITWTEELTNFSRGTAYDAANGRVYAVDGTVNGTDHVVLLDATTGDETWRVDAPAEGTTNILGTVDAGLVVNAGGDVALLDAADGSPAWDVVPPDLGRATYVRYVLADDALVEVAVGADGAEATALDVADGTELWSADLGDVSHNGLLVVAGDQLILPTQHGDPNANKGLIAVALADGTTVWSTDAAGVTTYVADGDTLYLADAQAGTGQLRALSVADGTERWSVAFPDLSDIRISRVTAETVYLLGSTDDGAALVAVDE